MLPEFDRPSDTLGAAASVGGMTSDRVTRPMTKRGWLWFSAAVLGLVLVVVAVTTLSGPTGQDAVSSPPPRAGTGGTADQLSDSIARLQQALKDSPQNYRSWAELGLAYVEQARVTADPSYYVKADGALTTSLDLNDADNDVALTGMGALSNARHEFGAAADWARQSQAINPAGSTSYGVLADALTQLGDYPGATEAIQRMLDLKPGLAAFTRASYNLELAGNFDGARAALEQALAAAYQAPDIAFCRTYLGLLSFAQGDLDGADEQYRLGLEQTPGEPSLLLGRARVAAARGDEPAARTGYEQVVNTRPLPDYLVEYGNYLLSVGDTDEAQAQFALFDTTQAIFKANGVRDSLTVALLAADQGRPEEAVRAAEQEWSQRQNIDAADALAWALHSAGRDAEALPYAEQATGLGRNAAFLYHRGVIEQSLAMDSAARRSLDAALRANPYFSPLHAPQAREALAALGGPL